MLSHCDVLEISAVFSSCIEKKGNIKSIFIFSMPIELINAGVLIPESFRQLGVIMHDVRGVMTSLSRPSSKAKEYQSLISNIHRFLVAG